MSKIILLTLIGAVLIFYGLKNILKLRSINKWKGVEVSIDKAEIKSEKEFISQYNYYTRYYPIIEYSYIIQGEKIKSNKVAIDKKGIWVDDIETAEKLMKDLIDNKTAYYNPSRIRDSLLIRSLPKKRIAPYKTLIGSGIFILVISALLQFY